MISFGYKLMSEEHGPTALLRNAIRAEQAGFSFAAISDHFSPWLEEEGHAPFAWSVLGAIANPTRHIGLMTAVTCPTMRYHRAIVAQAASTMALLSDNRFTLGLGSGERLNERVVGAGWPGVAERQERLGEAVDIVKGLLSGELGPYQGRYFRLDQARLFDRPQRPVPIVIAAGGPAAAQLAGHKPDGMVATAPQGELVEAYRHAGGAGPRYAEAALCVADREEDAKAIAHRYFRWSAISGAPRPEISGSISASTAGAAISLPPHARRRVPPSDRLLRTARHAPAADRRPRRLRRQCRSHHPNSAQQGRSGERRC
jgi:G6PDH family F420-dependent oxidoreductase